MSSFGLKRKKMNSLRTFFFISIFKPQTVAYYNMHVSPMRSVRSVKLSAVAPAVAILAVPDSP